MGHDIFLGNIGNVYSYIKYQDQIALYIYINSDIMPLAMSNGLAVSNQLHIITLRMEVEVVY